MKAFNEYSGARRIFPLLAVLAGAFALFPVSRLSSAQTPDGRPRRTTQTTTAKSIQTPAPTPAPVSSAQTPNRAAQTPTPTPTTSKDRVRPTLGEAPPPPKLRPKPTPTPPEEIDPDSLIRINTELVTLNVRVIDRNNRPIDNVRKDDFHVFEDGMPQRVEFFTREEVPISYGLAVDTSLSLRSQIQSVIDAAKIIVNSNKKGDETFIERFISSDKINIEKEFTPNKDELLDAVDNLYLEGGQTAVIDGVYLAAEHVAEYKKGDDSDRRRRALIVITDGEDRASFYKEPQLLRNEEVATPKATK